jgi:hypothetical protein
VGGGRGMGAAPAPFARSEGQLFSPLKLALFPSVLGATSCWFWVCSEDGAACGTGTWGTLGRLDYHGSGDTPGHRDSSRGVVDVPVLHTPAMFLGENPQSFGLGDVGVMSVDFSLGALFGDRLSVEGCRGARWLVVVSPERAR